MSGKHAVEAAYIAASTNRYPSVADCRDSLVALGSATYIALWNIADEHDRGAYDTLPGHEGNVTCVRIRSDSSIISGDDRGVLRIWRPNDNQYAASASRPAHSEGISALAIHGDLIISASSDSQVKIWQLVAQDSCEMLQEIQSISLRGIYPVALAVTALPQSQALILAVGSTNRSIQIFTRSGADFVSSASLAGHEDWVKALAFRPLENPNDPLVLASGSQDATIRLWNIEPYGKKQKEASVTVTDALSDELLDAFEESLGDLEEGEEGGRQISLKRHIITVKSDAESQQQFTITFDALLVGHEAGITSLSWRPSSKFVGQTLLSTSTDSSLILWSPSTVLGSTNAGSTSLWINRQRFGDVGGQRLGGFVGGLWSGDGSEALAWGWSGGWRRWRCSETPGNAMEEWTEIGAIGGHSLAVRGLAWSPGGEYLISTSLDQTTRIHGETHKGDSGEVAVWHEIGRPQVHGYDLLRVAFLSASRFISIADEKVARVFDAPREFLEVVKNLHVADVDSVLEDRPRAAVVPPLGLSNKAVTDASAQTFAGHTDRRPFEGELAAMTLWPEIEKVFGHGYESISLAVSNDGKLAATACKATSPEHAVVRVYDTEKWQPFGEPLGGHSLTVTGIAFSPDDRCILSISRDRTWRLFERKDDAGFVPVAADKSHGRIIWDCCWAHEGDVFVTASRDKTVKIWHTRNIGATAKWTPEATLKLPEAATAVALTPIDGANKRWLAVGLESGEIHIYVNHMDAPKEWKPALTISSRTAHVHEIHQLAWRPHSVDHTLQLASCSEDGTLKVLVVHTEQCE